MKRGMRLIPFSFMTLGIAGHLSSRSWPLALDPWETTDLLLPELGLAANPIAMTRHLFASLKMKISAAIPKKPAVQRLARQEIYMPWFHSYYNLLCIQGNARNVMERVRWGPGGGEVAMKSTQ